MKWTGRVLSHLFYGKTFIVAPLEAVGPCRFLILDEKCPVQTLRRRWAGPPGGGGGGGALRYRGGPHLSYVFSGRRGIF